MCLHWDLTTCLLPGGEVHVATSRRDLHINQGARLGNGPAFLHPGADRGWGTVIPGRLGIVHTLPQITALITLEGTTLGAREVWIDASGRAR